MIVSYPDDFEFEPGEEYGDINLFKLYLREISKFPLLTKEEEFNLSKKIANGDKQARKDLINSNLRLVVSIAKYYKSSGLDLMDLIQSGNMGLTKAADRFNGLMGYKFSTYAVWWIKQSILKEIKNTSRNIKLPNHVIDSISKYKELTRTLESKLNREPTSNEILAEMNIDDEKNYFLTFVNGDTTSLDNALDEEGATLRDFIPDSDALVEDCVISQIFSEEICEAFNNCGLDEREKNILLMRYGFDGGKTRTLEEIAKKYNVSRERIRQIEAKALRRLQRSLALREFVSKKTYDDYEYKRKFL